MEQVNLVKIGSDSVNKKNIKKILDDANKWEIKTGESFIFLSSGAVKFGRLKTNGGKELSKNALSGIGQSSLMKLYERLARDKIIAQMLIEDYLDEGYLKSILEWELKGFLEGKTFGVKKSFLQFIEKSLYKLHHNKNTQTFVSTISEYVRNDIWTIINHNDTTSSKEVNELSDKADNDKNTIFIAKTINEVQEEYFIKIKRVIYLTNKNGLLNEEGVTVEGGTVNSEGRKSCYRSFVKDEFGSENGTGGMKSKLNCSFKVLDYDVEKAIIANAKHGLSCLYSKEFNSQFYL